MALCGKCVPYEKSIVINALYDIIDALGLRLINSNSTTGILIVTDANETGEMRVALGVGESKDQTRVQVLAEDIDSDFADAWRPVILDELTGIIYKYITPREEEQQ